MSMVAFLIVFLAIAVGKHRKLLKYIHSQAKNVCQFNQSEAMMYTIPRLSNAKDVFNQ